MIRWAELIKRADDQTLRHCPRCGSGNVTGGSDGSITCGFCNFVFKVYAQPTHPFMPQTVDGQPYIPEDGQVLTDEPMLPEGAPPPAPGAPAAPAGPAVGLEQFRVDQQPIQQTTPEQPFVTAEGKRLGLDSFLAHVAIRNADDRLSVIEQVRERRG